MTLNGTYNHSIHAQLGEKLFPLLKSIVKPEQYGILGTSVPHAPQAGAIQGIYAHVRVLRPFMAERGEGMGRQRMARTR